MGSLVGFLGAADLKALLEPGVPVLDVRKMTAYGEQIGVESGAEGIILMFIDSFHEDLGDAYEMKA